ncbi:hypothetical protein QVD17_17417 [Tagetes erecta]|uniref:Uncharacterized protein n=1 Tax=Tagetes erecta TaxID=13708 RepID=A0AAD8KS85_TARER|nr:hypothetical protein QVD17_17417 [Tagetes erecta]
MATYSYPTILNFDFKCVYMTYTMAKIYKDEYNFNRFPWLYVLGYMVISSVKWLTYQGIAAQLVARLPIIRM